MRKYLAQVKIGLKNSFAYRADFFIWGFNELLDTIIFLFIWTVLYGERNAIGGFTLPETITYLIGIGLIANIISSWFVYDIERDVQSGWLSNLLLKPMSYPKARFSLSFANKPINLLIRTAVYVIIAFFFRDKLVLNCGVGWLLLVFISIFFAYLLNGLIDFIVGCLAFWTTSTRGAGNVLMTVKSIFAGGYAPISFFPKWFQTTASILPFFYTRYFPMLIYLKKVSIIEAVRGIGIQIVWVLVLYLLARFVWRKGVRKYEGVGI